MINGVKAATAPEVAQQTFELAIKHQVPSVLMINGKQNYIRRLEAIAKQARNENQEKEAKGRKAKVEQFYAAKKEILEALPIALAEKSKNQGAFNFPYSSQGLYLTATGHEIYLKYQTMRDIPNADQLFVVMSRRLYDEGILTGSEIFQLGQAILKNNPESSRIRQKLQILNTCRQSYR